MRNFNLPAWLKVLFSRRMLFILLLGFSSGLPLLAIGSTLQAWLKETGLELSSIGLFALVGVPYTWKFIWAPLMDIWSPPFLGRRRGWMLITQVCLVAGFLALAQLNPATDPWLVALAALAIAFFSASQDTVLDAYRREILVEAELGLGSGIFVNGYRLGMLVSGAAALALADQVSWPWVYTFIAAVMGTCIVVTLLAAEPERHVSSSRDLLGSIFAPFKELLSRPGIISILAFVLLYKFGDALASALTTVFVLDVGFTKTDLALIAKTFGLLATLSGGLIGGIIILRLGINNCLWIFGLLQAISTLGFALLADAGPDKEFLTAVIAFENLSSGMGTAAYAAYMGRLCNISFTATQYALLSSLMGMARVYLSAPSGYLAEYVGWPGYFIVCTALALPGMLLLLRVAPFKSAKEAQSA